MFVKFIVQGNEEAELLLRSRVIARLVDFLLGPAASPHPELSGYPARRADPLAGSDS